MARRLKLQGSLAESWADKRFEEFKVPSSGTRLGCQAWMHRGLLGLGFPHAPLGASSPISRMIGLQMPDCNSTDAVCGGGGWSPKAKLQSF